MNNEMIITHTYQPDTDHSPRRKAIELTSFLEAEARQAPNQNVEVYVDVDGVEFKLGCEASPWDVVFYDLCPDEFGKVLEIGLTEAISLITIELEMESY